MIRDQSYPLLWSSVARVMTLRGPPYLVVSMVRDHLCLRSSEARVVPIWYTSNKGKQMTISEEKGVRVGLGKESASFWILQKTCPDSTPRIKCDEFYHIPG